MRTELVKDLWDTEENFIRCALKYPVYAITEYGFLELRHNRMGAIWERMKDEIHVGADDVDADNKVKQILLESKDVIEPMSDDPMVYANEIQRLQYILAMLDSTASLQKELRDRNDKQIRKSVAEMAEYRQVGKEELPDALAIATKLDEMFSGDDVPVYSTGFPTVDKHMGGFMEGLVTVLGARQGDGKTTLALQWAMEISKEHPVLFYSMDMSAAFMWGRHACNLMGKNWAQFKLTMDKRERGDVLVRAAEMALEYPNLRIVDRAVETREIWEHVIQYKPALIVIDYIGKLKDRGAESVNKQMAYNMDALKEISRLGTSVLALAQLNRSREHTKDKQPMAKDIRDSGEIEEKADEIWMIYRDEVYNPDSKFKGIALFYPEKLRGGDAGVVNYLRFTGGLWKDDVTQNEINGLLNNGGHWSDDI